jgi:hypothetical protein
MLTARLAPARIAKTLYIDVRTLTAYLARLSAAAATPYPDLPPLPRPVPVPSQPRIVADRVFCREGGDA